MKEKKYYLNEKNEFVIEDYNRAAPFSSFLPAIAGLNGKPLWVYYVNRGQCIATFGINNKDYSIMEFQPANKAYRQTALQGFRTFLKIKNKDTGEVIYYEPFQDNYQDRGKDIAQRMSVSSYDIKLVDLNRTLGIKTEVMYCTLPGENIASLIRSLKITNTSENRVEVQVLDGLPAIIPYYLSNTDMKELSNLMQAWMMVENYKDIPFYRIKALPYDTPETLFLEGGNFYINVSFDDDNVNPDFAPVIVEPEIIFGSKKDFSYPELFLKYFFCVPDNQVTKGTTPCGFSFGKTELVPGQQHTSYTFTGNTNSFDNIKTFKESKIEKHYILDKINENRILIESLKHPVFTVSSRKEFDLYAGQTFLDNLLRGGYPVKVGRGRHTFYVYSRKHGDLEREYNFFQVDSTYYSQGNSNFRDVNQNRRNDICFFPDIGVSNIKTFFNHIQLDGFNPLVIKGTRFYIENHSALDKLLGEYLKSEEQNRLKEFISKPFTPGQLVEFMEYKRFKLKKNNYYEFLEDILKISFNEDSADFQEGYWVDHWHYNTDLLERYLAVYPDKVAYLLNGDTSYTYYDSYEVVAPRDKKYVLTENGVRQLKAVYKIKKKEELIKSRRNKPFAVRTEKGKGEIYYCTLLSKIIMLLVNKIASLDPFGTGVEMEANKPGWCDALNGLPALLGSSINETAAIKRLALIVKDMLSSGNVKENIKLYEEGYRFFNIINQLLKEETDPFEFWDKSYTARENYRNETIFGITGKEYSVDMDTILTFLKRVISKVDESIEKAYNKEDGVYYTYFINEVKEFKLIKDQSGQVMKNEKQYPYVKALKFQQRPIPYFLEGIVHILRMETDKHKARELYQAIKKTGLYDEKLGMYKVNDNIMNETKELGRQNIFPRGWLENEAIFLHMEYKYFLELLRIGLYDEFFECFNKLVPFMDAGVYGRSILENSSFIVSSVHPDKKIHGRGFVSRLTGASAEFLTMWLFMTAGKNPFYLDENNQLCLELKPVLPSWLFTRKSVETRYYNGSEFITLKIPENAFAFNFLGSVLTVYHNPLRKNTFGNNAACIKRIELHEKGKVKNISGSKILLPWSLKIRDRKIERIDMYLS